MAKGMFNNVLPQSFLYLYLTQETQQDNLRESCSAKKIKYNIKLIMNSFYDMYTKKKNQLVY